ncbi:putative Uncharacterized oxidoreductase [Glarea lozoyensis 74030]|nr:putative Uncharacterized oxidoreductase [Glarea lozoyensis 74030]
MDHPPALSVDGFEIHFATNHLGHSMLIRKLLPTLLATVKKPGADVRIVILTSVGWRVRPSDGVTYNTLKTKQENGLASLYRYGQSKLANLVYAKELARRYPGITTVSVHPGTVATDLVLKLRPLQRRIVYISQFVQGKRVLTEAEGALNPLWAAAGADKKRLENGGYYEPVGVLGKLDAVATDVKFARQLWEYTQEVLDKSE